MNQTKITAFFIFFISAMPLYPQEPASEPEKKSSLEITGGMSAGRIHSDNLNEMLRDGPPDYAKIGYFTFRYGSTQDVLRNYFLGKSVSAPEAAFSDMFSVRYFYSISPKAEVGTGFRHMRYMIENAPQNAVSEFIKIDEKLLVTGMVFLEIPNPVLRDNIILLEYADRLAVENSYALKTLSLDFYAGYHFTAGKKLDPYARIIFSSGREIARGLDLMEFGFMFGSKYKFYDRSAVSLELVHLTSNFTGSKDGFYKSARMNQFMLQGGISFLY